MFSTLIIAGTIISNPDKYYDEEERPVCVFTVVDSQTRRDKNTRDLKFFSRQYEIRAIGQEAESVYKVAKNGDSIITEGHPSLRTYITGKGACRGIIICTTDSVRFVDRKKQQEMRDDKAGYTQEQTDDDQLPELQRAGQG